MSPRKDIGVPFAAKSKKKKTRENDDSFGDDSVSMDMKFEEAKDPATIVSYIYCSLNHTILIEKIYIYQWIILINKY